MQGTIRTLVGLIIVAAAVGGIETGKDADLVLQILIAAFGIFMMASGVSAVKRQHVRGV